MGIIYFIFTTNETLYNLIGSRFEGLFNFVFNKGRADSSSVERAFYLDKAKELFYQRPIQGFGLANFSQYMTNIGYHHNVWCHNNYLELLSGVGDEGGFAPNLKNDEEALEFLNNAIKKADYDGKVRISLDVAASEMYDKKKKMYEFWKTGEKKTAREMITYYKELIEKYPIFSIEDGLAEEDWDGWKLMTDELGKKIYLVGDDLFVTNVKRLKYGIENKIANSILIKPNQIGTVSETIETVKEAKANGYLPIISHRSGETEDTFIADLSVGLNVKYIKTGAPVRGERTAKYNQLLRLNEMING